MAEIELRLHGRGGQGVVLAANIFAEAAFKQGWYARSLCAFGAERRGAPVTAFIRVSRRQLMPRCGIYRPDYVVCLDPGLLQITGLKPGGAVVINTTEVSDEQRCLCEQKYNFWTVDAREIAFEYDLISGGLPIINTAILGALSKVSGFPLPENLQEVIKQRGLKPLAGNLKAVAEGYRLVKEAVAN